MSSTRTFKKFLFGNMWHGLQKSVVVAVAKNIGNAKRNALHSKKMVLSLQIYICVQMFTNICSTAAIWFTTRNLQEYTLLVGGHRNIWLFWTKLWRFFKTRNRLPHLNLNDDDFVAEWKSKKNRRAKCNAVKYHVLFVEKKSRIY